MGHAAEITFYLATNPAENPVVAITSIDDIDFDRDRFAAITQQITEEKSTLITSGVVVQSPALSEFLSGGGMTFALPSYRDFSDEPARISSDAESSYYTNTAPGPELTTDSIPIKTQTDVELATAMARNQSWATANLAADVTGDDPMGSMAERASDYWTRKLQDVFVATAQGVFADSAAAPAGNEHVQGDMQFDASALNGGAFQDGVTNFSAPNFYLAELTMGDAGGDLGLVMVHSVVRNTARTKNFVETQIDVQTGQPFETLLGRRLIVNDNMPNSGGVYDTWLFAPGAFRFGAQVPKRAVARDYKEDSGNGAGSEILYNRVRWCLHPVGMAYAGAVTNGGPNDALLANAASWTRALPERKMIKMARLRTRES